MTGTPSSANSAGVGCRVFVARETTLGREVAIKVVSADVAATISVERFTRLAPALHLR